MTRSCCEAQQRIVMKFKDFNAKLQKSKNFANFHFEIGDVLSSHLGISLTNNVTIAADGMSTITLAAMSTLSSAPLDVVAPTKINYITNGQDFNNYIPIFKSAPSVTLFENYMKFIGRP